MKSCVILSFKNQKHYFQKILRLPLFVKPISFCFTLCVHRKVQKKVQKTIQYIECNQHQLNTYTRCKNKQINGRMKFGYLQQQKQRVLWQCYRIRLCYYWPSNIGNKFFLDGSYVFVLWRTSTFISSNFIGFVTFTQFISRRVPQFSVSFAQLLNLQSKIYWETIKQ